MIKRSDFLLSDDIAFLNHGSFGLCPRELMDVQRSWQERLETQPVKFHRELPELLHQARKRVSAYLGTSPSNMVFVTNSTFGVNVAAHSIPSMLQPGDRVLTTDQEYGACTRALQEHLSGSGIEIDVCPITIPAPSADVILEQITSLATDRTKALFFSHITAPTAIRLPTEGLVRWARERGIISIVDGSHVPGHLVLDLEILGADIYTGNFHKWMCTPKGSAFLYVRPELQQNIKPLVVSWGNMIETTGEGVFVDDHEYLGTRDPSPFLTVPAAIDWMERNDWWQSLRTARDLRDQTMHDLLSIDGVGPTSMWHNDELLMGAVTIPNEVDVFDIKRRLYDEHDIEVVAQPWLGVPIVRFSVHLHTRPDDLQRLVRALPQYLLT